MYRIFSFIFLFSLNMAGAKPQKRYLKLYYKAIGSLKQKRYNSALSLINKSLYLKQSFPAALNIKGEIYFHFKQYKKALLLFAKAIKLEPQVSHYYYNKAKVFERLKKNRFVLVELNKAILLNDNEIKYYENRARAFIKFKAYNKAIIDYRKILTLQNYKLNTYENMALCYELLNQYNKAIELYRNILKTKPNLVIYNKLASVYNYTAQYDKAIIAYNKANKLNRSNIGSLIGLSVSYLRLNNFNLALRKVNLAIKSKRSIRVINLRAEIYINMKHFNKAKKDIIKSIKIKRRQKQAYYLYGVIYLLDNNFKAGCSQLRKAAKYGSRAAKMKMRSYCL